MDLTWYDCSDATTGVVTELGSLLRHVRDRLGRAVGRVSRSRLSTSSRPTAALHYSVVGYRVNMFEHGVGEHCFRGGLVSQLFRSSKSGSVVARDTCQQSRTGWCCVVSTRLKPRGLAKPPRLSPLHVKFPGFFPAHIKGRSELGFQRNLELAFSILSPARRQVPLGSSGALREETPQDHQRWSTR